MDLFKLALVDVEETLLCNSLPEFHAEQATGHSHEYFGECRLQELG